ncbi:MAG: hypothetical protein Q8R70_09380 [Methanoregula sp.]|nr:hypothetical protein [Methanoregula sp.]
MVVETTAANEEVVVEGTDYSAHGLLFHVDALESGDSVPYFDKAGNPRIMGAQDGRRLSKFSVTVKSLDGKTSFYTSNFLVMDSTGTSYEPQCPIDTYQNCKNGDSLESMYNPIIGQKKTGTLIFSTPASEKTISLIYKFSQKGPRVIKFNYNLA